MLSANIQANCVRLFSLNLGLHCLLHRTFNRRDRICKSRAEGYISESVCQEETSFCRECGKLHCLCEGHDELRRLDIEEIINDIQDLVDNHHEEYRSDDDDDADIDDPVQGTGRHCARSNSGSDYHDDSDDGEGFCDCEDVDIRLCDGEIRARLMQNSAMDKMGY